MDYFHQESERLRFRKLTEEDIPSWEAFFADNDRLRFLGLDLSKSHKQLAHGWIHMQFPRYKSIGLGHLAVIRKEQGDFIGLGGILPRKLNGKDEFEVAYSLKPAYWGKGYATEIAQTMKSFGFRSLKKERLISMIHKENHASAQVALKNGMNILFQSEYLGMPVNIYGITRQAFMENKLG